MKLRLSSPYSAILLLGVALVVLFSVAACGDSVPATGMTPSASTSTKIGKPIIPVGAATATTDHALGLSTPPDATAADTAGSRNMLAALFPAPYQPVEQDVYTTRQPLAQVRAFYDQALTAAGYTSEVNWSDLGIGSSGASWAKQKIQVRVIVVENMDADRAQSLNSTYSLTTHPLQGGDTLIYLIGLDRNQMLK